MTKTCPICGSYLVKKEDESAYYCENPNCDRRQIESLIHFASREAMNITGFGERIIEDFYNFGYIKSIVDFYKLDTISEELKELEGFGNKSIENLLTEIENSKHNSLERLIFGLGIRYVGRKTANVFLSEYYNEPAIAVDTHVERVSKRLKIAAKKDDVIKIEKKLMKYFPIEEWSKRHLQMVLFGRYYCKAIKPNCSECKLIDICSEKKKIIKKEIH